MQDGLVLTPRLVGEALLKVFDFPVYYGPFIVGLRGAEDRVGVTVKTPVDHVRMRCRLLVMSHDQQGYRTHYNVQGTTAPGRHWLLKPMNRGGTAMIAPGAHLAHKRGLHKGKPALRQCAPLVVWRDVNRDARLTPADAFGHSPADCAINIHYGSTAAQLIGLWSAGCVVFSLAHYDPTYKGILAMFHPGREVPLYIVPFDLLERAVKEPGFRCLMIGSQGPRVRTLQKRLGVTVDGDFGINTARALIKFQDSAGVRADGICGPQTYKALGL